MATKDPIRRYRGNKKQDARKKGLSFDLSYEDLRGLLDEAGITIDQVGRGSQDYNLARIGDAGGYVKGNCRFITKRENLQERDSSYCGIRNRDPETGRFRKS